MSKSMRNMLIFGGVSFITYSFVLMSSEGSLEQMRVRRMHQQKQLGEIWRAVINGVTGNSDPQFPTEVSSLQHVAAKSQNQASSNGQELGNFASTQAEIGQEIEEIIARISAVKEMVDNMKQLQEKR